MAKTIHKKFYYKKRILYYILLLLFFSSQSGAQVISNSFNQKEKKYVQTLVNLINYLKIKKTPVITFHKTEVYSESEKLYDEVINNFFDKKRMLLEFQKDTSVFALEGKVDLIRHILNGCDIYLDSASNGSIFIEPNSLLYEKLITEERTSINISIEAKGKKKLVLICQFDAESHKLWGFILLGSNTEE